MLIAKLRDRVCERRDQAELFKFRRNGGFLLVTKPLIIN